MFVFTFENISKISPLVYSTEEMPNKKKKKIEYSQTEGLLKGFNYDRFKVMNFPKNASMQTYEELKFLRDLPEDKEFVEKHDDIEGVFKEVCKDYNVEYPEELVNELLKSSAGIILDLKYHYNRPRPKQLAKEYGMSIGGIELESMSSDSPSYPSGHSTQATLIANYLANKYPLHRGKFLKLGRDIARSRVIAKVHYPSDVAMGEMIGNDMFRYLKEKGLL